MTVSASTTVLDVSDLSVDYGYGPVVHELSFRAAEGEILAVLGPNGAGKTSTLRALGGFERHHGSVKLLDKQISSLRAYSRARQGIVYIPDTHGVFSDLSVHDNLWLASRHRRLSPEDRELVGEYFPILLDRLPQRAGTLSGGEQKMLAISTALLTHPSVLLIDELSSGLSPILVNRLFSSLVSIRKAGAITILLVEQFVEESLKIADRALLLSRGRLVLEGAGAALREDPDQLASAYFEGA